ncbi:lysophospholipid acyltransferase family protein [Planktotalea sp.]|uniref:lysophospholipid acyltransferase family protein n=1 Tax=Planktotalea sp. TaxID=2029877 RepID=UPI0025DCC940|nr:lysophospholipid acyltransferase family protein [Planktotalea sp.]
MTPTWAPDNDDTVDLSTIGLMGWLRFVMRAVPILFLVFGCLILLLLLRLIERPIFGLGRPMTPFITQFVCRNAFRLMGMPFSVKGTQMQDAGAVVANHSSWLDIFALNAAKRVYFVSKSEVARWPGIGVLAKATGTVFIERNPRKARAQKEVFEGRLNAGHKLLFFPEGTSTDGRRVLPFKSTLFAAFFTPELKDILWVQPVTVNYFAPSGEEARFYGWWGAMDFFPHLIKTLAVRKAGKVEVIYHPPLRVAEADSRKSMALACEAAVRSGHHIAKYEAVD